MDFVSDLFVNLGRVWTDFLSMYLAPWLVRLINWLIVSTILLVIGLVTVLFLVWLERKIVARIQDRPGPNRVGPFGLLQTVADAIKLLTKEDITPAGADRIVYNLAPALATFSALMLMAVLPWGPRLIAADLNIGVLYLVALGSVATMAILMAGWSSNNKYALLGGFRVVAQLLSYEIPMILAMASVVLLAGSMSTQAIVEAQSPLPYVVFTPLAFLIYLLASLAEVGRVPFDLLEAESELITGYNIEYSGMKFAFFFLAEFINTFIVSIIAVTLFLGGWRGPLVDRFPVLGVFYLGIKVFVLLFAMSWFRGTLPRFRIDQMQMFAWKVLVPVALVNLFIVAVAAKLPGGLWAQAAFALAGNVITLLVTLGLLGRAARRFAERRGERLPVTT
jgi:NADH-quinone oxidoreductase subunit H